MINYQKDVNLKKYHTLWFDVYTKLFFEISDINQLEELFDDNIFQQNLKKNKVYFLWEGSNTFFQKDFDWIVIKNNIKWKKQTKNAGSDVFFEVFSWEIWNDAVFFVLNKGFFWPENLVNIPWTVWAWIVQNIWAYWLEIKEFVEKIEIFDFETWKFSILSKNQCQFGYRNSIFKKKRNFFITKVFFKFKKFNQENYNPNLNYWSLKNISLINLTPLKLANLIVDIRSQKLPDFRKIWTAWSFFKNTYIDKEKFIKIKNNFPDIVFWEQDNGKVKISTWWLIDQVVWKDFLFWIDKKIWTWKNHALVLVNYWWTKEEFWKFIKYLQDKVLEKFWIKIEPEVVFV